MTSLFRMFSRKRTLDMESFETELKGYFRASTSFRSMARTGTVVVIDKSKSLFDFLDYLTKGCDLSFCVYHVAEAKDAKRVIAELGNENIKVVVINSEMLFESANGITLARWVNEQFPDVPVWISDCTPDMDRKIRDTSERVGILSRGEPLADYAEVLGFPASCREMAINFGT